MLVYKQPLSRYWCWFTSLTHTCTPVSDNLYVLPLMCVQIIRFDVLITSGNLESRNWTTVRLSHQQIFIKIPLNDRLLIGMLSVWFFAYFIVLMEKDSNHLFKCSVSCGIPVLVHLNHLTQPQAHYLPVILVYKL